jgi:hypothetical protein
VGGEGGYDRKWYMGGGVLGAESTTSRTRRRPCSRSVGGGVDGWVSVWVVREGTRIKGSPGKGEYCGSIVGRVHHSTHTAATLLKSCGGGGVNRWGWGEKVSGW